MTSHLAEHINRLTEAINEVKAAVKAETYGIDPSTLVVTPKMVASIKVEI